MYRVFHQFSWRVTTVFRIAFLLATVSIVSSCADDIDSPRRTYTEFVDVAYAYAGADAMDCGSGDKRDLEIISCLQNAFDNGIAAAAIFGTSPNGTMALTFKDTSEVKEYVHFKASPEKGGDGKKAITRQYSCTAPSSNPDAKSGYGTFNCDERILIE